MTVSTFLKTAAMRVLASAQVQVAESSQQELVSCCAQVVDEHQLQQLVCCYIHFQHDLCPS